MSCGVSLGANKAYDAKDFANELRSINVRPHVALNDNGRRSTIDGSTTPGYGMSMRIRKRFEEGFGWIKPVGGQSQTRFKGRGRVGSAFTFPMAAYNLIRLPKLMATPA